MRTLFYNFILLYHSLIYVIYSVKKIRIFYFEVNFVEKNALKKRTMGTLFYNFIF